MSDMSPLILCVDDEPHIRHVMALKLQNAGYRVITAEDGEEALKLATQHVPDLVVTDYQMPYLCGLELCLRMRQQAATRDTPVVMLTARGFSLEQEQLEATNVKAVLSKPFSPREVLTRVRDLVGEPAALAKAG